MMPETLVWPEAVGVGFWMLPVGLVWMVPESPVGPEAVGVWMPVGEQVVMME